MLIVFDLDDTLYDEIDFVKSGFREIAHYLGNKKYYDFMWNEFLKKGSGTILNSLIDEFNLEISLDKLIEIYRFHFPAIKLDKITTDILSKIKKKYKTALITDGHYIMQKNKFRALGLEKFIDYPMFTDFYHTKKPELKPFKMIMKKIFSNKYVYIADNPKKDFFAPIELDWITIRFKNPKGIYKNLENNAHYETDRKKNILEIIEVIANK
jgi:putative hydrolase of the HAD superfamily